MKKLLIYYFFAVSLVYSDPASKEVKLLELMKIQGFYEMIDQQSESCKQQGQSMADNMLSELKKQIPDMDPVFIQELKQSYDSFVSSVKPNWTTKEAVAAWVGYYGAQLTEGEVDQLLIHYKSPLGQKDIAATKSAMPKWTKFFADRNQQVLEPAVAKYIQAVRDATGRAMQRRKAPKSAQSK